jgi:hypothetical protein
MGYDVHITRAAHFHESAANPITEAEWLDLVAADPELCLAEPHEPMYFEGMVVWNQPIEGYGKPWFDWLGGKVYTKRPQGPIIEKMVAIAQLLGARVQGDFAEEYLPDGRVVFKGAELPDVDWRTDAWLAVDRVSELVLRTQSSSPSTNQHSRRPSRKMR